MDIVGKSRTARQDTAEDNREDTARTPVDTDTDSVSDDDLTLGPDGLTDVERTRQTVRDTLRAELSCDDDDAIWGLTLAITRALHAMPRHAPQLCTVDMDELRTTIRDSLATLRPTDDDAQARGAAYYASVTGLSEVRGICPACRRTSLFLGSGGYLTCAHLECTAPDSATTVMENPPWAADECGRPDCTETLRKMVFLHHEVNTAYETLRFNVNSAAMWLIDYKHQSAFARARQSRRFLHGLGYMLRDRGPIKPLDRQGTGT